MPATPYRNAGSQTDLPLVQDWTRCNLINAQTCHDWCTSGVHGTTLIAVSVISALAAISVSSQASASPGAFKTICTAPNDGSTP